MNILTKTKSAVGKALVAAICGVALASLFSGPAARAADPPVHAAQAPGAALFGSVDIQKISAQYSKAADYNKQLSSLQQQYLGVFQQQQNYPMLSKDDQTELGTLLMKTAPTSDDTAMINQLEAKSNSATQTLNTLQNTANPTEDQKAQMQQLVQMQKNSAGILGDIQTDYNNQLQQKEATLSAQVTQDIKAAIAKVAQQHGMALVFDAAVAVYSANDITDDVLKVLNK